MQRSEMYLRGRRDGLAAALIELEARPGTHDVHTWLSTEISHVDVLLEQVPARVVVPMQAPVQVGS